jgi:nucleotide-binding universal stress UspA family protein
MSRPAARTESVGGVVVALAIAAGWVAIGAVAVALMRRRGHDAFTWAVLFLFLGPLAVPIAVSSDRHRPTEPPRPLPPGGFDLLVSYDGSPDARAALEAALTLLGPQMTTMTLATVIDLEAPSTVRGRDTQREAQRRLDTVVRDVSSRTTAPIATVILFGEPATALHHFAVDNGYELIVAGSRLEARSLVGGRRTGRAQASVSVLLGPTPS